jgi:F0F1-type ATP synthase delta subunit
MDLKLPTLLAGRQDIIHVHRELGLFLEKAMQSVMRHDNPVDYPAISATLRALAIDNQIDLRDENQCRKLQKALEDLKDQAPSLHISFPSDPAPEILQKMVTWFRREVHPHIIIQVGLQPTIAAGVVIHTVNRRYDFSLRRHLMNHRQELIGVLRGKLSDGQ